MSASPSAKLPKGWITLNMISGEGRLEFQYVNIGVYPPVKVSPCKIGDAMGCEVMFSDGCHFYVMESVESVLEKIREALG